jgi:hypothetical protein
MKEFRGTDELRGARFDGVDLSGSRFRNVNLAGVKMVDALLAHAELSGLIDGLVVNGVEVAPLIAEELRRRYPERERLFSRDPVELRAGWSWVEQTWDATVARAKRLPESILGQRVDEEWSFVETLRHLVFVTDAWIGRVVRGEAHPYHRIGLPPTFLGDLSELGIDPTANPTLDEVLEARAQRVGVVRQLLDGLGSADLERRCAPNDAPGYPPETECSVRACLWTVMDEEWAHHRFAVRDLDTLDD